jgi:Xaa-Pro aminopeptidase
MGKKSKKLGMLREAMQQSGTAFYWLQTGDPHIGEYLADHWQCVKWLTGFSGSLATVVVTRTFAGLWTDSRYFIQAREQIEDSGFVLMKMNTEGVPSPQEWIRENITRRSIIGFDGRLMPLRTFRLLKETLEGRNIIFNTGCDLITGIWENRPPLPDSPAFNYPPEYAGVGREDKIRLVREGMKVENVTHHILTSPEDIMWMLNIRGNDVRYSPLLMSFCLISPEQVILFANEKKIPFKLAAEFDKAGIVILPYEETTSIISAVAEGSSVLINPSTTSVALSDAIPNGVKRTEGYTVPELLKAVKNETEIDCLKKIMIRDGQALVRYFIWLENKAGSGEVTESGASDILNGFRVEQQDFFGNSFPSIIAWKANGAKPHYSPDRQKPVKIEGDGLLLTDSGGHYLGGTTDITRTVAIGKASESARRDFTLVLKGMIALASAVFPAGTRGYQLDILARQFLWNNHLNYGHGTGHGVGSFLTVHEGPHSVSGTLRPFRQVPLEPGMIMSNEPAVYREGEYGIRTENLLLVVPSKNSEFGSFLTFESLSLCYIDKGLIDGTLLSKQELDWLNSYHRLVYEKLSPGLSPSEKEWLKLKTSDLSV